MTDISIIGVGVNRLQIDGSDSKMSTDLRISIKKYSMD